MSKTDLQALPSAYDHHSAQSKWYAFWEQPHPEYPQGYFHADPARVLSGEKKPYSVVIPPPNVTGALHLGHALNNTLQDILCRYKRMQGYEVLWMPGTDHAGIATQAVVERRILAEEGKSRHDLATKDKTAREALVDRIWEWKAQYEERITGQLKQLGASCDWQRQRFTLDDQCARAVRETFFKLFSDNKVYRGKRLVNWDTFLQTAVSDDEVFHEEKKGHFWSFHYPVVDPQAGEPKSVTIATTRPETMLGDTAVAVHPEPAKQLDKVEAELREKLATASDKEKPGIEKQLEALAERRKTHLPKLEQLRDMAARGAKLKLPLCDREIPLIADEWAKPELGSGAVKITPAHDANDYAVWQRSVSEGKEPIGVINLLQTDGTLADTAPEKYRGLTMKEARKAVLADLETVGAHDPETDVEDRLIELAHSDRSKTPIEPFLADQWFVKMDELAQSAMDAVTDESVKIIPERYGKTYLDWLSEKRDWPVGRQLWWGHRIPVWLLRPRTQEAVHNDPKAAEESLLSRGQWAAEHLYTLSDDGRISVSRTESESHRRDARSTPFELPAEWAKFGIAVLEDFVHGDPIRVSILSKGDAEAAAVLEEIGDLAQDEEVLDTWFSSALWPFSTMGWPEQTDLLKAFYPTATLITSRDIITLWVARMVLMGKYLLNEVPFPEVYIHPKVLDGFGETMSKSKGNGVDPLDVIEQFGADALRFGIAYLTTETQDVRMPVEFVCPGCDAPIKQTKKNRVLPRIDCPECNEPFRTQWAEKPDDLALPRGPVTSERFELGRNFCNKLWNASRFALTNLEGYEPSDINSTDLKIEDRWLLSRLATVAGEVTTSLDEYRFADAARALYDFAWNEFCSFYLEMTKARLTSEDGNDADKQVAQGVLAHALDTLLRLLHPMTPFLTEEVWHLLAEVAPVRGLPAATAAGESVCVADWPVADTTAVDRTIEEQFAKFQAVLGAIREVRQAQQIPNKETIEFTVKCDAATAELLEPMQPYFTQMARATAIALGPDAATPDIAASKPLAGFDSQLEVHVDVAAFIDVEAEKTRLGKEQAQLTKYVGGVKGKLSNEKFVANAPADVVAGEKQRLAEAETQLAAIEAALAKL